MAAPTAPTLMPEESQCNTVVIILVRISLPCQFTGVGSSSLKLRTFNGKGSHTSRWGGELACSACVRALTADSFGHLVRDQSTSIPVVPIGIAGAFSFE